MVGVTGGRLGHGGVAAAFGLAVAVAIFLVGHVSGAHLNPAVTVAMAAGRHVPAREVAPYWCAHVATDVRAQRSLAALAVGGTIALAALVMGPITGASMNPARSPAPAAVSADWADLWLYTAAPLAGALLGAALSAALRARPGPGPAGPDIIAGAAPAPLEKEDVLR